MDVHAHWSNIYTTKPVDGVSWYQAKPELSLKLIAQTGVALDAPIIDVGAGASTLVDHLVAGGYSALTLLDIADEPLAIARARLGAAAERLRWLVGDVTRVALPEQHYAVWHDRAVFHFLTDATLRQRYVEQVRHAVRPGGHVIVATFASDGPQQCSGLDVMRYDAGSLHGAFGDTFTLVHSTREAHQTPWGSEQRFVYCYCRVGTPSMIADEGRSS